MLRKSYSFRTWRAWAQHIDGCVQDFHKEFGQFPNLLVANGVTLRRVNVAADKGHVSSKKGAPKTAYVELQGFAGTNYNLHFAEEEDVTDNGFSLIFVQDAP